MYGAVIFDNLDDSDGPGWAALCSGEVIRFNKPETLPYNVYWWANIDLKSIRGFMPRFKAADYLTPSMMEIHSELGMTGSSPQEKARIAAEIFGRVMTMARDYYGVMSPQKNTLHEDISKEVVFKEGLPDRHIHEALKEAHSEWVDCSSDSSDLLLTEKVHTIVLPRIQHAVSVLSSPVPSSGTWEKANIAHLPLPQAHADWCLHTQRPLLAKVHFSPGKRLASLLPCLANQPRWMTHSDVLMASRFGSIRIEEAYYCESSYGKAMFNHAFYAGGFMSPLSISCGVLAANYLKSATSAQSLGGSTPGKNAEVFTPQAVWMSSSDRGITLAVAVVLKNLGYDVIGYGQGKVRFICDKTRRSRIKEISSSMGLEVEINFCLEN